MAAAAVIFRGMKRVLDAQGLRYSTVEDRGIIRVEYAGSDGVVKVSIECINSIVKLLYSPSLKVSASGRMGAVAFMGELNFGLVEGNFEMDFADGDLRCALLVVCVCLCVLVCVCVTLLCARETRF